MASRPRRVLEAKACPRGLGVSSRPGVASRPRRGIEAYVTGGLRLCRWLIEVNASPSLTASSKEDYDLKCRLLDDVLNVVDLENR